MSAAVPSWRPACWHQCSRCGSTWSHYPDPLPCERAERAHLDRCRVRFADDARWRPRA